ncbi:cell division protein FtsW [Candidatus Hakubella thermalkaliphila]|uniref:Probable peptidoglycan glycosyltransferase FtsW n=1 Tax=Candidatus Hakubella thermalkaliphila TaxID=2754717 RepID=A0A6V8NL55_9ACTN|nr:putative lipid II flippase FtsW [Candidatus Hakubella thermalkaliphila]GFP20807.1 cell division protein FtsW [Candidatus Hakubella thermalkaliphila]
MDRPGRAPRAYYFLLGLTIVMFIFGTVMVSSASTVVASSLSGDTFYLIKRQLAHGVIGVIALVLFSSFFYQRYQFFSYFMILACIGLLSLTLIPGAGIRAGGAQRWLDLGLITIQPSEIAKLFMVIFAADILVKKERHIGELKHVLVPIILAAVLVSLLVFLQPNLGAVVVMWISLFAIFFVVGVKVRHLLAIAGLWSMGVASYIVSADYRLQRILAFLDKTGDISGSGFQLQQSLIALGSGHLTGLGLGLSRQKFGYLPAAHTDFIFAIVGEELGLVGTAGLVIGFLIFVYLGIQISLKTSDLFGRLLAVGLTTSVVSQALINIGATTGLAPVTGIPLPFISFGGSSLVVTMASIGILLNIARKGTTAPLREVSGQRRGQSKTIVAIERPGARRKKYLSSRRRGSSFKETGLSSRRTGPSSRKTVYGVNSHEDSHSQRRNRRPSLSSSGSGRRSERKR